MSNRAASTSSRSRKGGAPSSRESAAVPKPSASLVLLAPLEHRSEDGYDYRVLLLKRNAKSSTFMSAHVFPGGNLDPVDQDEAAWAGLLPQVTDKERWMQSMKLCAIRETFEECGILMLEGNEDAKTAWSAIAEEERRRWRTKVHDSGPSFINLFRQLSESRDSTASLPPARPALSSLRFCGNWITPRNLERRFDTHFFISILPPSSSVSHDATETPHHEIPRHAASADNTEMTSLDWMTPLEAIRRPQAAENAIVLYSPQFYLLAELVRYKSWRDLIGDEMDASGRALPRARQVAPLEFETQWVVDDSGVERPALVLIGDVAHSQTVNAHPSDRHRTYDMRGTLSVIGVQRRGISKLLGSGWEDLSEGDVGLATGKQARL